MSSIFLSHSSKDSEAAAELMAELDDSGHRSVFLDFDPEKGIPAGRNWEQELYSQLRRAAAVIVLCSHSSRKSPWCFAEITHAKALGKPIFPILLDDSEHHPLLTDRQTLSWTEQRQNLVERLARALAEAGLESSFPWDRTRAPYPGLLAFEAGDAAVFFGRAAEVREGLETLERLRHFGRPRALLVLGTSGSGKSSLVRAGLVPRLCLRPEDWLVVGPLRPGSHPFRTIALGLSEAFMEHGRDRDWRGIRESIRADGGAGAEALVELAHDLRSASGRKEATLVLVIDQMEELLGPADGDPDTGGAHAALLASLAEATRSRDSPLMALFTLRADFLGRLQAHPAARRLAFADLKVGPMSREGLLEVVREPARVHDLRLEEGLAEAIVADAGGPDALPLMAFALRELFEHYAADGQLEIEEYRTGLGGLGGALARVADSLVAEAGLTASEESRLRDAFLSMASLDADGRYTSRRARWEEIGEATRPVLERFVEARLLVSHEKEAETTVEVAHETLFRSWDRLGRWLEEDREFLLWRKRLEAHRLEWERTGSDPTELQTGPALEEARKWLTARARSLSDESADFIRRSIRNAAIRRRRRVALIVGSLAFLLAAAMTGFGLWRWAEEEKARALDATRVAVASDWMARDPTRAALALLEVERPQETGFAIAKMREALDLGLAEIELHGHAGRVLAAEFDPDGDRVASASADGTARIWKADGSGDHFELTGHEREVHAVRFSSDGARLLTAAAETVRVWQADGPGEPILVARHPAKVIRAEFGPRGDRLLSVAQDARARIWQLDGSPDPREVGNEDEELAYAWFSRRGDEVLTVSWEGRVRIRPADGAGSPIEVAEPQGFLDFAGLSPERDRLVVVSEDGVARLVHLSLRPDPTSVEEIEGKPLAVAFGTQADRLVTAENGGVRLWPLDRAGAPFERQAALGGLVLAAASSPQGDHLAVASEGGRALIWLLDGRGEALELRGHRGPIRAVSFDASGRRLLTASDDGSLRIWQVRGAGSYLELAGHDQAVVAARFSEDGERVVTASLDKTARVWRLDSPSEAVVLRGHAEWVRKASFSPTGDRVVTASQDGTARLWNADGSGKSIALEGHEAPVVAAWFDGEGRRVLTASEDKTARIWPVDGSGEAIVLRGHEEGVRRARFSPAGNKVATVSLDSTARVWPADGGGEDALVLAGHQKAVKALAFALRGGRLATGSDDGTARIWRTDGSGEPILLEGHEQEVVAVAFDPEGDRLVTASNDRTARIWRLDERKEPLVLDGHSDRLTTADFSPEGDRVITASSDGTARVWSADGSGEPLLLEGHRKRVTGASFSPDGRRALTASEDGTARVWLISAPELKGIIEAAILTCLPPEFRRNDFGESAERAERTFQECERARRRS